MVFTVMDFRTDTQFLSLRHLERLKTLLRRKCEQLEILVIVQELLAICRSLLRRVRPRGREVADSNPGALTTKEGEAHRKR
jgi:hypothetical protein